MGNKPTPIDRKSLPVFSKDAVPCWKYNAHIAIGRYGSNSAVSKVWVTSTTLYRSQPNEDDYTSGSRDIGKIYATESEAWEACIAEVQDFFRTKLDELRDAADASKKSEASA